MSTEKNAIIKVVEYMANAQTAEELTKVWGEPFTWFDTGNCVVRGLEHARQEYIGQFHFIENLRTKIISIEAHAEGNIGFAYSVQNFLADGRNGAPDIDMIFRQTDCLIKENGEWKVVHQHVSLPADFASGKFVMKSEGVL